MSSVIRCSELSFAWPDGSPVLTGLNAAFASGRTGLIGVNGSGKSTLLRIIAGILQPSSGTVCVTGEVGYLPQDLTLDTDATVSDLLGVAAIRNALHAIEAGDVSPETFSAIGDDWDVEDRARVALDRFGLVHLGLDYQVERLSGGETIMVALAALFLRRPEIILLDEPTNNLDLDSRRRLQAAVAGWPGVMVIVSHDRELLGLVDQIADLSGGALRMYGGNLAAYEELRAAEQDAAERAVVTAEADVRRQRRDLVESQVKQARRDRYGKNLAESGSMPPIVAGARKRQAQVTAGRSHELHTERLEAARDRLAEAEQAVRDDAEIRVKLPGTAVPAGRTVLTVTGLARDAGDGGPPGTLAELIIRGPERVALTGPNGGGKTTLLRAITGAGALDGVRVQRGTAAVGYLPQRLNILDESLSIADNVRVVAPTASPNEVRAGLARFLFRGGRADQLASTLSGGERFRAVLAALLLAQPPPQLLLLDEPTNNLDMASVRQLTQALAGYRGAILAASHDVPFLRAIGITRWLRVDRESGLAVIDPL